MGVNVSILFLFILLQSVHFQSVVNTKGLSLDGQIIPASSHMSSGNRRKWEKRKEEAGRSPGVREE
jgi:hypothetical protein